MTGSNESQLHPGWETLPGNILRAPENGEEFFREDPQRILLALELAASRSLTIHPQTLDAMIRLRNLTDDLPRKAVFKKLCKLLPLCGAEELIAYAPVLAGMIPELEPMIGFDQRSPHHAYDLFRHTACVTAAVPRDVTLRWAALLHDTGKITTFTLDEGGRGHFYGHAGDSAAIADRVLRRLSAPTGLRADAVRLISLHMTKIEPTAASLRRWQDRLGPEMLDSLLALQEADMASKGVEKERNPEQFSRLRQLAEHIRAGGR